ncbi:hypothetical protein EGR_09168 [Echinococcus granulosus]|uniref:Uncharacterized protein n=1 Tax=Echinococcus granulosus TaxID=6210 RepID=W6URH3_ECHGR|nr:hypothetical protein EGR_09168 [Echinococcus granulosus]EUB55964.1 hypothetical protein EGR_09168 [Echinococcus granulosus]
MSTERSGPSGSAKSKSRSRNRRYHKTSKDASLSFPIKRSTAALQEPPSVFEKSPILERLSKRPFAKQATPSPKRPRKSPTNSKDAKIEKTGDVVYSKKDKLGDERDDTVVTNVQSSPKDQRRSRKKKRRDKERKRSSKKRLDRKSNEEEEDDDGKEDKAVARKDRKRKITKSPISDTLVAAYSSDGGDESHPPKRTSPATLPRAHAASSPVVHSERKKNLASASSPCAAAPAPVTKVTKGTAKSTWDSSDSDFEETIAKPSTPPSAVQKSAKTPESNCGVEKTQKDSSVSRKRSHSRGRSRTASSGSASSSSCSSRRRSYSSRSYSSRRRSYSTSSSVSSSSRSSSRSYSRRRRSRRRRRHGRRRHRRSSTPSSYSRSSYSRSSSRGRGSRRRRYSRSSGSYRRRSSYRSYSSHSRRGRYTSSERSRTPNSRDASRTPPPPVCRRTVNQRNSGGVTAAGVVSPAETRLSRPLGNKGSFIRGHKPSEAVAAAASAAVRKITGRTEPSPPSTPPALPKTEEPEVKEESNEEEVEATKEPDSNYIGPQVPPDMAKKLGLSVDSSPPLKSTNPTAPPNNNNNASNNANSNNWKAHVGAKRKSERAVSEGTKKQEEIKADFMTPPEKDDQYKALQEQAKEHVRQQMQLQASQQQQLAAAAAAVASAAAVQPATTASVAMLPATVGHFSVIDQLRQRQQICLLSGAMDQALALENIIRQHQQVEAATALQQQQQALQMLALQQHQHSAIIAAQQQQVQQHQVQSAQQAALLLAAQQHQAAAAAAASHADSTGAAAAAAMIAAQQQQQQAVIQTILQQRQQQALAAAAQQQQQQQIQMLLQMKVQQQAAAYATAVAASSATPAVAPSNAAAAAAAPPASVPVTTTAAAVANTNSTNGALSASEPPTGSDATNSQSPTMLAAMAAAQRNQAFQQEQLQKQINAAAMVSASMEHLASAIALVVIYEPELKYWKLTLRCGIANVGDAFVPAVEGAQRGVGSCCGSFRLLVTTEINMWAKAGDSCLVFPPTGMEGGGGKCLAGLVCAMVQQGMMARESRGVGWAGGVGSVHQPVDVNVVPPDNKVFWKRVCEPSFRQSGWERDVDDVSTCLSSTALSASPNPLLSVKVGGLSPLSFVQLTGGVATGMALTQQQQQRQQLLALQAAAVAAQQQQQQPATAPQPATSPNSLSSAVQQQLAAAALYQQQQVQSQQQQQQHAVALLFAAQQSRMLRPS